MPIYFISKRIQEEFSVLKSIAEIPHRRIYYGVGVIMFFSRKKRASSSCSNAAMPVKHRWLFWLPSITGLFALVWFLVRVIPKPSRATYPCQRVAFPLASGFIIWLIGLAGSVVAFRKARRNFLRARYIVGLMFISLSIGCIWLTMSHTTPKIVLADSQPANEPMGTAQGIYPGRVVWVHDANATNENCTNTYTPVEDGWFLPKNNNQAVIDKMVSQTIRSLTGENSDETAWDALFKNFNRTKGRGNAGYIPGQKIMIKANFTSTWGWGSAWPNINSTDYSIVKNGSYGIAETSPEIVLAFLRQLVNVYGVRQQDISIGDPLKHIYKHTYDLLHAEFPNVIYIDHQSSTMGRTPIIASTEPVIFYSDRGTILHEDTSSAPVSDDYLPTCITEANYMINIASLKGHARAGITLCAKNHFGSQCREDASHLHEGLVSPDGASQSRTGMGLYRVQVDLMGHKLLGGNTVLNVVDGLWGGPESVAKTEKWITAPFNNDYTSSIFASQDQVALESVCFDFLKTEYTQANHPDNYWPQMAGVDDYLHQAADSNNWPADINYDPENDGTLIGSLGVHEHWNDANNKQYTRNLDPVNGQGIELVNPALDHYWVSITKCTVTAGKNNMGTISISGVMDVNANNLTDVNSFTITVDSNNMLSPCTKIFPVDGNSFKNGKYSYAQNESGSKKSFKYDTATGKFSFAAKNIGLSGLYCPVTMRITIGDFAGAGHAGERIVNGQRKPAPIKLMLGVKNTLRIDKCKVTKGKDKLSVKAALAVEDTNVNLADVNVTFTLDSQTFTIPVGGFVAKKNKFVCTNAAVNEGGFATGTFDANNCLFAITIKQTSITSPSGYVNLGVNFADFNESGLVWVP
jgi:hypothetical protein